MTSVLINLHTDVGAQREDVKPQEEAAEAWGHRSLEVAGEEPASSASRLPRVQDLQAPGPRN